MGRAPCCEKMGLKKGPWTPEEDLILINFINTYGHNNWRALPKQAGLLRCGKSCRLRWINYLRPDIKRGNFTTEEEDTIIKLHEMLGNRWSAIAARLPGRTDNEIKNVWHTHLKKRLPQDKKSQDRKPSPKQKQHALDTRNSNQLDRKQEQEPVNPHTHHHHVIKIEGTEERPVSPPQCSSSDMSTLTTSSSSFNTSTTNNHDMSMNNLSVESMNDEGNLALDEDFWSEVLSSDNTYETRNFQDIGGDLNFQFSFSTLVTGEEGVHIASSSSVCDGMDFWYDVYSKAEELPQM